MCMGLREPTGGLGRNIVILPPADSAHRMDYKKNMPAWTKTVIIIIFIVIIFFLVIILFVIL